MVQDRDVITVDGTGASGKSTLAKLLAKKLGFGYLNSGLLYRAAGYLALKAGVDPRSCDDVVRELDRHTIALDRNGENTSAVVIDGAAVSEALLSSSEASVAASLVGQHQPVRDRFLDAQRTAFAPHGVVAEGRDMGTIVFPDAPVKFFVDARLEVRAQRRFTQLQGSAQGAPLDVVSSLLAERDQRDASRAIAPMKAAEGAITIDNSDAPLEETVNRMLVLVRERLKG